MNTDRRQDEARHSPSALEAKVLLDLTNALTALGNYLAVATRISMSAGQSSTDDSLGQVLEKSQAEHERAVGALRELRTVLQR